MLKTSMYSFRKIKKTMLKFYKGIASVVNTYEFLNTVK